MCALLTLSAPNSCSFQVVDGAVAFTGGRNIAHTYAGLELSESSPRLASMLAELVPAGGKSDDLTAKQFRDCSVRIEGPAALHLAAVFMDSVCWLCRWQGCIVHLVQYAQALGVQADEPVVPPPMAVPPDLARAPSHEVRLQSFLWVHVKPLMWFVLGFGILVACYR